ncbi:hypothetical protein SO694_00082176 [Aureococcus anophagefferens]|uniref:ABC transporter domain-containing protein n=1 Tax=Aureococcus anophagefferens TaxID=44056 RepID=A0ABR1FJ83_AURAN
MPQRGLDASAGLAFEGVVVKLQVKKAQRVVVDGACGRVGGGGLLAVLGASGAGKTTLLAALAGEVACEGLVDRPSGVVAYCPQDDLLLPFLTAGDAAPPGNLRLDRARDQRWRGAADRAARGDALLATLGLEAVAAARVGSRERRGVRARVFATFTDCLVLAPGGSPAYSGAAAAAPGAVAAAVGAAVPPLTSAAEYLLSTPSRDPRRAGARASARRAPSSARRGARRPGTAAAAARAAARGLGRSSSARLNNRRSPVATTRAVPPATMALLVGALYAGSRGSDGQDAVSDRTGALFFVLINQAFSAMASLAYVLVGLRRTPAPPRARAAFLAGATLAAESLVLLVGAVAADAKTAVVICPQLSLFRWSFAALLKAEFAAPDVVFTCTDADRAALARRAPSTLARPAPRQASRGLPCPTPDGATHVARVLGAAGAARSLADDGAALAALVVVGFRVLLRRASRADAQGADAAPAKQKAA